MRLITVHDVLEVEMVTLKVVYYVVPSQIELRFLAGTSFLGAIASGKPLAKQGLLPHPYPFAAREEAAPTHPSAMVLARTLPYAGIDASWEEQQFVAFQQLQRTQGTTVTSYADFVFGRLLEEDLHVSCMPMLLPRIDQLHGVTLQGMCILQVRTCIDVAVQLLHTCLCACMVACKS